MTPTTNRLRATLARVPLLPAILLALHAPGALAMTQAELRAKLKLPEDAQVKEWTGVADRTIVVSTAEHPDPDLKPGDETYHDRTLLVVQTSTGEVMQKLVVENAYVSDAIAFTGLTIDTADYALAEGHRAFGLRVATGHAGCAGYDGVTLELFDVQGASIRQVLTLTTHSLAEMCDCGDMRLIERTVAIAATRSSGYADLLVRERRSEAADGKMVQGACIRPERRTRRQFLLHFDGQEYQVPETVSLVTPGHGHVAA